MSATESRQIILDDDDYEDGILRDDFEDDVMDDDNEDEDELNNIPDNSYVDED